MLCERYCTNFRIICTPILRKFSLKVDQKEHELTTNSSGFGNGLGEPIDLFSDSNGVFSKPHEDTGFDFKSSKVAETDSLSDSYFQSDQNDIENRFDSHPPVQHADSDESFGDFKAAFSETESKHDVSCSFI